MSTVNHNPAINLTGGGDIKTVAKNGVETGTSALNIPTNSVKKDNQNLCQSPQT